MISTRLLKPPAIKYKESYHDHITVPPQITGTLFGVPIHDGVHYTSSDRVVLPIVEIGFSSVGYNGIVNWIGTNGGTTAFLNPATNPRLESLSVFSLSMNSSSYAPHYAVDNQNVNYGFLSSWTPNGQYWGLSFASDRVFRPTHYAILGHQFTSYHPRNWKFQGSMDGTTWVDIDTQVSNTSVIAQTWASFPVNSAAWNQFRILQTGLNSSNQDYLAIGEFEMWGVLLPGSIEIGPRPILHFLRSTQSVASLTVFNVAPENARSGVRSDVAIIGDEGDLLAYWTHHNHYAQSASIPHQTHVLPVQDSTHAVSSEQPQMWTQKTINWVSNGYNGLIDYIGKGYGTTTFANPHGVYVQTSQSSDNSTSQQAPRAVDHLTNSYSLTTSVANSWWKIDLGEGYSIRPTRVGIIGRSGTSSTQPRNWRLEGSNDDTSWTTLFQASAQGPGSGSWFSAAVSGASNYRYLRIFNNGTNSSGTNSLQIGDFEVWGTLSPPKTF